MKRINGRLHPETPTERRIYDLLVDDGWRPRQPGQAKSYQTLCPECLKPFWTDLGLRTHPFYDHYQQRVCSQACLTSFSYLQSARRRLLRGIVRSFHHRRVLEYLDERGWRTESIASNAAARTGNYRHASGAQMHYITHPNLPARLRLCTGYRRLNNTLTDIHCPVVGLTEPLTWRFYCVRMREGLKAGRFKYLTPDDCHCNTCNSYEKVVSYQRAVLDQELAWEVNAPTSYTYNDERPEETKRLTYRTKRNALARERQVAGFVGSVFHLQGNGTDN